MVAQVPSACQSAGRKPEPDRHPAIRYSIRKRSGIGRADVEARRLKGYLYRPVKIGPKAEHSFRFVPVQDFRMGNAVGISMAGADDDDPGFDGVQESGRARSAAAVMG